MLSRIAESLYWIGRYLERAEGTSRILDDYLYLSVEDPFADSVAAANLLLSVMGVTEPGEIDNAAVMRMLCYDVDSPSSVVASLHGARESARRSRETVSIEMWESINTTWHAVQNRQLERMRPAFAFRWIRERCAVITATADGTMSRDLGWYFLRLGRSLERIDMVARLVEIAALTSGSSGWSTALRSIGAHHAFVQQARDQDSESEAVQFILLDRLFPGSLINTLDTAIEALDALEVSGRQQYQGEAARLLGHARADLEFRDRGLLLQDLPERMTELQIIARQADNAITRRYFEGAVAPQWHEGAL